MNGVVVLALALVVAVTWHAVRSEADTGEAAAQTATVDTGAVSATVSASGNVEASGTAEVTFEGEGGTVTQVLVEAGDKVQPGQALATVDQTSARQGVSSARAQLAAAQASYETTAEGRTAAEVAQDGASVDSARQGVASAQLALSQARQSQRLSRQQLDAAVRRAERAVEAASGEAKTAARTALTQAREARDTQLLQARQQVAQQEQALKAAQTQLASTNAQVAINADGATEGELASAQAQVIQAQVSVEQAQEVLEQTTLRAPMKGTVSAVNGEVGESSSTASSSTETPTGFITLTTKTLEVTAYVAEADISDVQVGQAAVVTLSATDQEVAGVVTHVDTVETVTNNVVEYGVTVRLDEGESKGVRLGATAQLVVTTGEKDGVTRVSSSALTSIGDRTTATVQHDDGTTETVQVTTGLEGDSSTEVLDGLEPGDVVVLPEQTDAGSGGFTFPGGGAGGPPGGGIGGVR